MRVRKPLERYRRLCHAGVVTMCLGASVGACAKEDTRPAEAAKPALTSAETPPQSFRFAPPDGIEFTRNDTGGWFEIGLLRRHSGIELL